MAGSFAEGKSGIAPTTSHLQLLVQLSARPLAAVGVNSPWLASGKGERRVIVVLSKANEFCEL